MKTLHIGLILAAVCSHSSFIAAEGVELKVVNTGSGVELNWPSTESNYFIEASPSLSPPIRWDIVANEPIADATVFRVLLPAEEADHFFRLRGWDVLFNGGSTSALHGIGTTTFPSSSWKVVGNELQNIVGASQPTSLLSYLDVSDFELTLEWAAGTANANSGIYFRTSQSPSPAIEIEFQLLNDAGYQGLDPRTKMGSAYGVLAAQNVSPRSVGQFNQLRLVAVGSIVEHWVNGIKVLSYDTSSTVFRDAATAGASFLGQDISQYAKSNHGFIMLQYHNGQSRFRNVRVRSLN